jgi:hypothetical protein
MLPDGTPLVALISGKIVGWFALWMALAHEMRLARACAATWQSPPK